MEYRVRSSFVLDAQEKRSLCAPYDGTLDEVLVKPGEMVQKGQLVARMRTDDYELQKADAEAQRDSKKAEGDKARAAASALNSQNKYAEALIAWAQAESFDHQAKLYDYKIKQASILAPFTGVMLKGDLIERQGAPVKQGDALFEIARGDETHPDRIAVEAAVEVSERDIQEVQKAHSWHRQDDGQLA